MKLSILTLVLSLSATIASAQDAQQCGASFPARLAEAKQAIEQWSAPQAKGLTKAQQKAVEFFGEHCRFLTQLEIVVRRLNDPSAYVCDAPQPKGLTAKLVLQSQDSNVSVRPAASVT